MSSSRHAGHLRAASALNCSYAFSCSLLFQAVPYTRCSIARFSSPRQYAPALPMQLSSLRALPMKFSACYSTCTSAYCKHTWV